MPLLVIYSLLKLIADDRALSELTTKLTELPQNDMSETRTMVSQTDPCHAFSNADFDRQEFYSPGYPEFYPNHTDCVLVLEGKWKEIY